MRQLFVCHTQYNLILAVGLSSPEDDLILFLDFKLAEETGIKLKQRFRRCMFLEGNYPKKERSAVEKLQKITNDNRQISDFICISYDRIFIVDDCCIQEMYALKCAYRQNKTIDMSWLEDGAIAYFDNGVVSGGWGATPLKRFIRKYFFSVRFGLFGFYDLASCMGAHKRLKSIYVTFPESIRSELQGKMIVLISDEQFINGIRFMYEEQESTFEEDSILIAMDKLDVYGEKIDDVNRIIGEIVEVSTGKVYYKYHPRETVALPALTECIELDRTVAFESYLANSSTSSLTVIGIKSTSLQTAKKIGFKTISLIKNVEKADEIVKFYHSIGIICK